MSAESSYFPSQRLADDAITRNIIGYLGFDPNSPITGRYEIETGKEVHYRDIGKTDSFVTSGSQLRRTLNDVFDPFVKATILAESSISIPRAVANIIFRNDSSTHSYASANKEAGIEAHFKRSRDLMLNTLQYVKRKGTAILFGPGPLEIEGVIPEICKVFEKVILVGNDPWYLSLSRTCNKIQVQQIDLTRSYEQVLKIIESGKNINEKLMKLFDDFKFEKLSLQADLAISSLVTSQLGDNLIRFLGTLEQYFSKELGLALSENVQITLDRFSVRLIEQHFRDLHDLRGIVYHADTMHLEEFGNDIEITDRCISDEQLSKVQSTFKIEQSDQWFWVIKKPYDAFRSSFRGSRLLVKASIMKPNKILSGISLE